MRTAPGTPKFALVFALAGAMLAGTFTPSYAAFDKTRFVIHLGIAYFAFHHWVWLPYKAGMYDNGAPHRISTTVKGGIALLFAVHEVQVADKIAKTSNDPLLQKLDGALTGLSTQFATIGAKLKAGNFDPKDIEALNGAATGVGAQAAADHAIIKDVPVTIPGQ